MAKKRSSLSAQLTISLGLAVSFFLVLFMAVDLSLQRAQLSQATVERMAGDLDALQAFLTADKTEEECAQAIRGYCSQMTRTSDEHQLAWASSDGKLLAISGNQRDLTADEKFLIQAAIRGKQTQSGAPLDGPGGKVAAVAVPLPGTEEGPMGALILLEPLSHQQRLVGNLLRYRLAVLVVVLGLIVAVVFVVVRRRVVIPLKALFLHEYDVSRGILETRNYPDPNNEISSICDMFNSLVLKIRDSDDMTIDDSKKNDHVVSAQKTVPQIADRAGHMQEQLDELSEAFTRTMKELRITLMDVKDDIQSVSHELEAAGDEEPDGGDGAAFKRGR